MTARQNTILAFLYENIERAYSPTFLGMHLFNLPKYYASSAACQALKGMSPYVRKQGNGRNVKYSITDLGVRHHEWISSKRAESVELMEES